MSVFRNLLRIAVKPRTVIDESFALSEASARRRQFPSPLGGEGLGVRGVDQLAALPSPPAPLPKGERGVVDFATQAQIGCLARGQCSNPLSHLKPLISGRLEYEWLMVGLLSLFIQFVAGAAVQAQQPADNSQTAPHPIGGDVEKEFDEIFAQPEFRGLREKKPQPVEPVDSESSAWLKEFFDWIESLFRGTGNALSGLGVVVQTLAYTVLAATCVLIIRLVIRAVNNYQKRQTIGGRARGGVEEGEGEIPPGDLPADEYLRRAAELAAQGLYREAIGQLILGAMSRTERSGLIRFRRGLTNRDYLRALHGRSIQHQSLRTIVGVYEPICFGRRPPRMEHYRTSLDEYQTGFQQPLPADTVQLKTEN